MRESIAGWQRQHGIPLAGVCEFEQGLPLLPCRAARRVPGSAASVIVAAFPYYTGEHAGANVSRYAMVADYHRVVGRLLGHLAAELRGRFPSEDFQPFVDNSPLREVQAARAAGLGIVGRNGQLITGEYGSYVFLGAVVTSLRIPPDNPNPGGCGDCGRCLAQCPTGALTPDGLDKDRCRSHITQKKGALTQWERDEIQAGGLVWGCDICQNCCPHNQTARPTPIDAFRQGVEPRFSLNDMDRLLDRMPYGYRGPGVLARNWHILGGG